MKLISKFQKGKLLTSILGKVSRLLEVTPQNAKKLNVISDHAKIAVNRNDLQSLRNLDDLLDNEIAQRATDYPIGVQRPVSRYPLIEDMTSSQYAKLNFYGRHAWYWKGGQTQTDIDRKSLINEFSLLSKKGPFGRTPDEQSRYQEIQDILSHGKPAKVISGSTKQQQPYSFPYDYSSSTRSNHFTIGSSKLYPRYKRTDKQVTSDDYITLQKLRNSHDPNDKIDFLLNHGYIVSKKYGGSIIPKHQIGKLISMSRQVVNPLKRYSRAKKISKAINHYSKDIDRLFTLRNIPVNDSPGVPIEDGYMYHVWNNPSQGMYKGKYMPWFENSNNIGAVVIDNGKYVSRPERLRQMGIDSSNDRLWWDLNGHNTGDNVLVVRTDDIESYKTSNPQSKARIQEYSDSYRTTQPIDVSKAIRFKRDPISGSYTAYSPFRSVTTNKMSLEELFTPE